MDFNVKPNQRQPMSTGGLFPLPMDDAFSELAVRGANMGVSNYVLHLLRILYLSGCRISSIMSLDSSCVLPDGNLLLPSKKGSRDMLFCTGSAKDFWIWFKDCGYADVDIYTYQFWHRLCNRLGITILRPGKLNRCVTHSPRVRLANEVYSLNGSLTDVSVALGHKSIRSSSYYIDSQTPYVRLNGGVLGSCSGSTSNITFCKNGVVKLKRVK